MLDIKTIILELIRDVKSRKFLVTIGFAGLVVANNVYKLGISIEAFVLMAVLVAIYVLIEGLADFKQR